jgi:hypothetical protein
MTVYGPDGRPYQHEIPGSPPNSPAVKVRTICGLDLAQRADYTALAYIEQHKVGDQPAVYKVRRLRRWRDTPYTAICAELAERMRVWGLTDDAELVVDATGVGIAVLDQLATVRLPVAVTAVTITGGFEATRLPGGDWHTPKRDLISTVSLLLEQRRLEVAADLPEAQTLVDELASFQTRTTAAGNDQYGTWREGAHDDLVLATALATWYGEQRGETMWF